MPERRSSPKSQLRTVGSVSLKVHFDLVSDAGVQVIGSRQDQDARSQTLGALREHIAARRARHSIEPLQCRISGGHGVAGLGVTQPGNGASERLVQLLRDQAGLGKADQWRDVGDLLFGKYVALSGKSGLDVLRSRHHARAGQGVHYMTGETRRQGTDHRREQDVDFAFLTEHQLAIVTRHAFDGIAAVNCPASPAECSAGLRREYDAVHAKRAEESNPELMRGPDVENARDPDAEISPAL
jgi:hypothetical protein